MSITPDSGRAKIIKIEGQDYTAGNEEGEIEKESKVDREWGTERNQQRFGLKQDLA